MDEGEPFPHHRFDGAVEAPAANTANTGRSKMIDKIEVTQLLEMLIEPSDATRSQWDMVTEAYVDGLEQIAALTQPKQSDNELRDALGDVAKERQRQIDAEGWSLEHDDSHDAGQLAVAAGCYALASFLNSPSSLEQIFKRYWPWDRQWWKPESARHDLIRAGALIVAEIERLDRAAIRARMSDNELQPIT